MTLERVGLLCLNDVEELARTPDNEWDLILGMGVACSPHA